MTIKNATVLVIDDDPDILTAVRMLLKTAVKSVVTERHPENIRSLLAQHRFDLVLLDMNFNSRVNTGNEGLFWLAKVREWDKHAAVVVITAYGDIDLAIRAMKEGAADFVLKPWHNDRLIDTLAELCRQKASPGRRPRARASDDEVLGQLMVGDSEAMQDLYQQVTKIAPTEANVLVLGENGTGKELVAQAIHLKSLRASGPFVKVDVGALTDTLFESELFGHKKGAFTDAREDRAGRFEHAHGGTLFLDEIGNISLYQQAKLLSVLQNRQVTRLGANQAVPIDIRLVCATNLPLAEMANDARFRKDLVYRINTVEITVPPLRKRPGDIVLLARHFARLYAEKYHKPVPELDLKCIDKLTAYPFPGNVRELQYTMERAVIMSGGDVIRGDELLFSQLEAALPATSGAEDLKLATVEKNAILKVIEKHQGNISKAARELGITRAALYRRLGKYDM